MACLLLWRPRAARIGFFALLIGLIVVAPFARISPSSNPMWQYESYLSNMDGIALGCLCALFTDWCWRDGRAARTRWPLVAQITGAILMAVIAVRPWPMSIAGWRALRGSPLAGRPQPSPLAQ